MKTTTLFPSLIGRLKRSKSDSFRSARLKFPSLIGRLKLDTLIKALRHVLFPSLIGRLKRFTMREKLSPREFPSLIGRLKLPFLGFAGVPLAVFPSLIGRLKLERIRRGSSIEVCFHPS